MSKVGDTLYLFDINRRLYSKAEPPSIYGTLIYSGHFRPVKIIGENKVSWLLEYGHKAPKKDPRSKGFFTVEEMADDIWLHKNRPQIQTMVGRASAVQVREIAEILGYREEP